MRLRFKPFPGLTIVTLVALAILIALGTWQYQRLQWKTNLLAQIDAVADAPPFTSFAEIESALDAGEPIDFRRYGSNAIHLPRMPFFVFTSQNRNVSWRVFSPVKQGVITAFAALGTIDDEVKGDVITGPMGEAVIVGYVRLARPLARGETKSTPDKNRWFAFNPMPETHNWADNVQGDLDMRFYIDTVPQALDAHALPARKPDIRNNHFDYMLTWYGLAIVLFVIYLIMHRRAGRLSFS